MTFAATNAEYFARYKARDWVDSYDEVVAFARDMVAGLFLHTAEDVIEYLDKPWHWEREHAWWVANARPDSWEEWERGIDEEFEVES